MRIIYIILILLFASCDKAAIEEPIEKDLWGIGQDGYPNNEVFIFGSTMGGDLQLNPPMIIVDSSSGTLEGIKIHRYK